MTEYSDIPQANILYTETQKVDQALKMIDDASGTLTAFTIGPKQGTVPVVLVPIQIHLPDEAQASTMTEIRAQLVTYQQSLLDQLAALDITSTPPVVAKSKQSKTRENKYAHDEPRPDN